VTHGGRRPGAGRPLDPSATRHVWRYRATDDEEGRRLAAGQTTTERIRIALALLAQTENER
jgi:acyl-coenzyme A thioesterase PaaI-like protein